MDVCKNLGKYQSFVIKPVTFYPVPFPIEFRFENFRSSVLRTRNFSGFSRFNVYKYVDVIVLFLTCNLGM